MLNTSSLVVSLTTSILGSYLAVYVAGSDNRSRAHHRWRIFNEFLVKHQMVYMLFFFNLAAYELPGHEVFRKLLSLFAICSLISFIVTVDFLRDEEKALQGSHKCQLTTCTAKYPWSLVVPNLIMSVLMLSVAFVCLGFASHFSAVSSKVS